MHTLGDSCLESAANFLLQGDVYNSHHFSGFETMLKVLVGGVPPPKSGLILFLNKITLILQ